MGGGWDGGRSREEGGVHALLWPMPHGRKGH